MNILFICSRNNCRESTMNTLTGIERNSRLLVFAMCRTHNEAINQAKE